MIRAPCMLQSNCLRWEEPADPGAMMCSRDRTARSWVEGKEEEMKMLLSFFLRLCPGTVDLGQVMEHSAATLTPFPSSLCSKAAQWPKQEPAADHCNIPTWSSKLITILCRMEVFNAPDGCQPTALLERH